MTTAFGGVPMGVAIPPILAAKGMLNAMPIRKGSEASVLAMIGNITVIIMAVVAVLLINAESRAVTTISPRMINFGLEPKGLSKMRVRFLSRSYLTAASASTKPPKNSIMIGLARVPINSVYESGEYSAVTSGNRTPCLLRKKT